MRLRPWNFIFFALLWALSLPAAEVRILKVLPHYLDQQGRHALSPSLYERDAYQAHLRQHSNECSGLRFHVQWKSPAKTTLQLRLELRGLQGHEATTRQLEQTVERKGWFSRWSDVTLAGEAYQKFGQLSAWRATLWDGSRQVAEQKSFLW